MNNTVAAGGILRIKRSAWRAGGVDVSLLREAIALIAGRVPTEASGNVTLASAAVIAATGVDFISCGALTHSIEALDVSLRLALQLPEDR